MDGVYVHIPFCKSLCKYCDFLSFSDKDENFRKKYAQYVVKELDIYKKDKTFVNPVTTLYFGGGTPSILDPYDIKSIIDCIHKSQDCEITLEVNPKTVDLEQLKRFKAAGVNRLSIGIQSFNDEFLKILGRPHSKSEGIETYKNARAAGFENISLDLMFSLPGQSIENLNSDLEELFSLNPEHFSIYSLIWEEDTPFYEMLKKGVYEETDNEKEADMFALIIEKSAQQGYIHYEISNFSKSGKESKHNSKYWKNESYLGVGLGASGYLDDVRYKNFIDFEKYYRDIESGVKPQEEKEFVSPHEKEVYRNILGLRLLKEGVIPSEEYREKFEKLRDDGFLEIEQGAYKLTERGLFYANDVFEKLI